MFEITGGGVIAAVNRVVRIAGDFHFEAPKAAAFLQNVPESARGNAVEELLDHGAAVFATVQSSASIALLDSRIAELFDKLDRELLENLGTRLHDDRDLAKVAMIRLLGDHREAITQLMTRYVDPNSKDGLPQKMAELLEQVTRRAVVQVDALLDGGEEGALNQLRKDLTDEIKQAETRMTREITAKKTLLTKSMQRGGQFEDVLAAILPMLVHASGSMVEHCARVAGEKARKSGDFVITLNPSITRGEDVRIVVEGKSQKTPFSIEGIRQELKIAKANRGATAAIFVADSAAIVPDQVPYARLSPSDFVAVFDQEVGDEWPLICAIDIARVAALESIRYVSGESIDLGAAQQEVATIHTQLENLGRLETAHSHIEREVITARTAADDMKLGILASLRRLDAILGNS